MSPSCCSSSSSFLFFELDAGCPEEGPERAGRGPSSRGVYSFPPALPPPPPPARAPPRPSSSSSFSSSTPGVPRRGRSVLDGGPVHAVFSRPPPPPPPPHHRRAAPPRLFPRSGDPAPGPFPEVVGAPAPTGRREEPATRNRVRLLRLHHRGGRFFRDAPHTRKQLRNCTTAAEPTNQATLKHDEPTN